MLQFTLIWLLFTGILSTLSRSGGTINPEITTLEMVQVWQILYRFPYDREGCVYTASTFYRRIIKIHVNPIPARQEKRAFLRGVYRFKKTFFFIFLFPKWLPKVEVQGKGDKKCIEKIYFWPSF